jgi:uncharacterized protein YndB with AHSA1/START domain
MERTAESVAVERELEIAASPETVWQFLVDPEKAKRWMGTVAAIDARPGGEYRIEVIPANTAAGEFVEVDPPRRLVYTWGWEQTGEEPNPVPPGSSTIEIDLEPSPSGTTLRFVHRDLPDAEAAQRHGHGWDHYLGRLAVAAAGGEAGPDPWVSGEM